ncbi:transcription termination factor Rho [Schaalia naturae]|uniref:Transcription termination factor Rho n=1 Tax=Schaalia naturae TaxID=635203 RepID=A0ABW2SJG0_9ACTO
MKLAELQALASQMGLKGTYRMRKSELAQAIAQARGDEAAPAASGSVRPADAAPSATPAPSDNPAPAAEETPAAPAPEARASRPRGRRRRVAMSSGTVEPSSAAQALLDLPAPAGATDRSADTAEEEAGEENAPASEPRRGRDRRTAQVELPSADTRAPSPEAEAPALDVLAAVAEERGSHRRGSAPAEAPEATRERHPRALDQIALPEGDNVGQHAHNRRDRNSRRRGRGERNDRPERNDRQGRRERQREADIEIREDDVLAPIAGILDVQDNHAFVRTSGYLPGSNDVYVTLGNVRRWGLRPGDAVSGAVRQPREGERQRQKYNALARVDTVNGMSIEDAQRRREFGKLTPLYPTEQLRMETTPKAITPRVIDLVAPIGKGQRGLIVSPPKAGKTMIIQQIAKAIEINNPDVHLMVVLVDERPEEVTDMRSIVKGEVIASTFDRPASDHTIVAELAIERAKRLVELGQDVVVLLDSLTRLSRAYNLAAPASGRILSGGVDASALYPPKKFFGAARNLREGGSLTIIASALVETGSKMDEVIFEEFKGTGNMELRLSRQLADRRIFPAIDVNASGTRREEMLLKPEELRIMWKLRRVLGSLDQQSALEAVLGKLKDTQSNAEFLMVVQKTTPNMD